ncbi:hypothetical protein Tco_0755343 [Tanacetum coccineum]
MTYSLSNIQEMQFDSQVSNWEDGISTSSLSEAEEKTIKAVYEQMKSLMLISVGIRKAFDDVSSSNLHDV